MYLIWVLVFLINISYKDFETIEVHRKERFDSVSY